MESNTIKYIWHFLAILLISGGCSLQSPKVRPAQIQMPDTYLGVGDSSNSIWLNWREYFADDRLSALVDTALKYNQELNILLQEVEIEQNEIKSRRGEYLPMVKLAAGAGLEKEGLYTRKGAVDEQLEIRHGQAFPEPLGDLRGAFLASWELDFWSKLRNAKKSAEMNYLASVEGRKFVQTQLVAEIATTYYELMALDYMLEIIDQNIDIQSKALKVVRLQKESAKLTQLAVNRFEAQLLNTQNLQFEIRQSITERENRIRLLTASQQTIIHRSSEDFTKVPVLTQPVGIPSRVLLNRPDIVQAECKLAASRLDVKSARAAFYPSFDIAAGMGFQAFNPSFLLKPESLFYNLAGDLLAPLINRSAIEAAYASANARQLQAVYQYEQTVLSAYLDVLNQISKIQNLNQSFETKSKEVEILSESVHTASNLFNSARADYAEVLLTQREALDARLELIEIKMKLLEGKLNLYRVLGGGWN